MTEEKVIQTVINSGTVIGSTYSQAVNVTVTDIDVTIEFAFIFPNDPTKGQVVSRVTMPKSTGVQLAELILTTDKIHEKRKGDKKDD